MIAGRGALAPGGFRGKAPTFLDALDRTDPLRGFRDRFVLPDGVIYLDGNSLGALPRATAARLAHAVTEQWGARLIRSWNESGWIEAPQRVGAKIAAIVGAEPHEVIVADSTSVNLFKLLVAALRARPGRRTILSERGNFPTDLYIAQGIAALLPDVTLRTVDRADLHAALDTDVAVLMLTHVHYKTGACHDMAACTAAAQAVGALTLWDLSHSVGALPLALKAAGADLAVGCGYKYLNGGPGAPAFLYAAERHHDALASPLTGWMGHVAPFDFTDAYQQGRGLDRFLCGTPSVLAMTALETGVDLFREADPALLFAKSRALCTLFIDLVGERCAGLGLTLATPGDPASRGSHVAFRHAHGYEVMQALIAHGVIGDFRAPDLLRFGLAPLYIGYADVWTAVDTLREILTTRSWDHPSYRVRNPVT